LNSLDSTSVEDTESVISASVMGLKSQLNDLIDRLSPERLRVLTDLAAYLADTESEAATQELLAIPGLLERVKQNEETPKVQYNNWRTLHILE
jgi:hypothetical protein